MLRKFILCLMVAGLCLAASAENKIKVSSVSGHPGDIVDVEVSLSSDGDASAMEVVIPLDKQTVYVEGSAVLDGTLCNGHELSASSVDGELRIYVYSLSLQTLKAGEGRLATFKLRLKKEPADYTLTPKVVMSSPSGTPIDAVAEAGSVTLLSPKLAVTTPSIDYGHIPIRSVYEQTLTLQNVGNEPLEISGLDFSAKEFSAVEENFTIGAGGVKNLIVKYAPTMRGMISETVTIVSNAINGSQKATLKADPFSVNELHVGSATGSSDTEVEISLTVNNMEPLTGMQCSFRLPDALEYVDGSFTASARASSHTPVASYADGKLTVILYSSTNKTFAENDGVLATFKVRLDGASGWYGITPENAVLSNATAENMTSATTNGSVTIRSPKMSCATSLDCGRVSITETADFDYTISNSGQVPLTISKVAFLAEGYAVKTPLPITIGPNSNGNITIEYTPSVAGKFSTKMNIYGNDPTNRMQTVDVSGTVYEPNTINLSGKNCLDGSYDVVVGLDNYTDAVAVQMDIRWLKGMKTNTAAVTPSARLANHGYTVADMGEGVYRIIVYSMSNTTIKGNEGELFTIKYTPDNGTVFRDTEIKVENVVISSRSGANCASESSANTKAEFSVFQIGDTNGDNEVDVSDVMNLVNYVLKKNTEVFIEEVSDVTEDDEIDVADAMGIVNIVLKKE